jgi:hypothetical protein
LLIKDIIYLFIYWAEVEPSPLVLGPLTGIFYQLWMIDEDDSGVINDVNEWQRKPK